MKEIDWEETMTATRDAAELAARRSERLVVATSELLRDTRRQSQALQELRSDQASEGEPWQEIAASLRQTNARLHRLDAAKSPALFSLALCFAAGLFAGLIAPW